MEKDRYEYIANQVFNASLEVHRTLGAGLLESVYVYCFVALLPIHEALLLTYLKLANKKMGFLINFNVTLLKNGFKRKVNNY